MNNCALCGCLNSEHGTNGFIDWCANDNCKGVLVNGAIVPCITDHAEEATQ